MSGHTNRNKRNGGNGGNGNNGNNGGNPRSRHGAPRQRGPDGRAASAPKSGATPPTEPAAQESERRPGRDQKRPFNGPQPPAQATPPLNTPDETDRANEVNEVNEAPGLAEHESAPPTAPTAPPERQMYGRPRGRAPYAATPGGQAYIPASGPHPSTNGALGQPGQNGQNGHHGRNGVPGLNGYMSLDSQMEPRLGSLTSLVGDDDETNDAGTIPATWRTERLNGGADTTPREPFRPESRGEVGSLVDALHELFARDRSVASQGDGTRCGICYLHFPLGALEYREAEGFYVCTGCKRLLGHQQVMMIRRQQTPHGG